MLSLGLGFRVSGLGLGFELNILFDARSPSLGDVLFSPPHVARFARALLLFRFSGASKPTHPHLSRYMVVSQNRVIPM